MSLYNVLISLSIVSLAASLGPCPLDGSKPISLIQEQDEKPTVDYSKGGNDPIMVPFGIEMLEEKQLPPDLVQSDQGTDPRTAPGVRVFATPIEPGQTLTLTLKSTPVANYSLNWVLPSDKSHPLYTKIKLSKDSQDERRSHIVRLKNNTKGPCQVFFSLRGYAGQPYAVKLERK